MCPKNLNWKNPDKIVKKSPANIIVTINGMKLKMEG